MGFMDQVFGGNTQNGNRSIDETLALNSKAGIAAAANAYLTATLEATTPEVRRLFSDMAAQCVIGQESLVELSLERGWVKPYDAPINQLNTTLQQSSDIVNTASTKQ